MQLQCQCDPTNTIGRGTHRKAEVDELGNDVVQCHELGNDVVQCLELRNEMGLQGHGVLREVLHALGQFPNTVSTPRLPHTKELEEITNFERTFALLH